jgi:23S rRNA pseudouridine1911/1915/1917 synthase
MKNFAMVVLEVNKMDTALSRLTRWDSDFPKYFGLKDSTYVDLDKLKTWILYEDDDLLIINKPGWLVCHPEKNGPLSSLLSACRVYCGIEKLHLVNRLDRETSGVVVVAKNSETTKRCQAELELAKGAKEYLVVLNGVLRESVSIDRSLEKDTASAVAVKQMVSDSKLGKLSKTEFIPLTNNNYYTLAKVLLYTGRKHQIRTHAYSIGNGVLGDKIYGHDDTLYLEFIKNGWTERMEQELLFPRQALHAWKLKLNGKTYIAPLPQDLKSLLVLMFPDYALHIQ